MIVKLNSKIRNYDHNRILPSFYASVNRIHGTEKPAMRAVKYGKKPGFFTVRNGSPIIEIPGSQKCVSVL
jgi:hypothetical protein